MREDIKVEVGSIWKDRDKRAFSGNRHLRVESIFTKAVKRDGGYVRVNTALCRQVFRGEAAWLVLAGGTTEISLDGLRKRFDLVPQ